MNSLAIIANNLTRRYAGLPAVDGLSFEIPTGSVTAYLGRNGAGKTTTIKLLLGLEQPSSGEARVLGYSSIAQGAELRRHVGYVPEAPVYPPWMTAAQLISYVSGFYPDWDTGAADELARKLEIPLNRKPGQLSRGDVAKLALVLALGHNPELLILDDPIAGLDPLVRREFFETMVQAMAERGQTVFFSSHLVSEVERIADRVVIIERGRLLEQAELSELKKSVHQYCCRLPSETPMIQGLLTRRASGPVDELVIRGEPEQVIAALSRAGANDIQRADIDLEGVFVALVRADKEVRR